MGSDPKTSVTNGNGQTHDVPNLFIAGASLFPTTGAVAATYTISALADKTAEFITKNWSSIA
jgi:choline dehydrogenase-like flavoprotein